MQGEISADFTAMSQTNMIIFFAGIATLLALAAAIMFVLVRKLGISSIGMIKIDHKGQSAEHRMNEAVREVDDNCRKQMRQITGNMKIVISNIFAEENICTLARVAISMAIRFPMYESIANNHFTTELTKYYDTYRERITEMMREEYISLAASSKGIPCKREALPPWETVSVKLTGCIDLWLKRICKEVMLACERKEKIYEEYLPVFETMRDTYRAGFAKECREKNIRYADALKARV